MVLNWFQLIKMQSRTKNNILFAHLHHQEPSIQREESFFGGGGLSYSRPYVKNVS